MHTPGPWTQATHSPTDVVSNKLMMVATAHDGLNGIPRDQSIANARLIAAAPELLDRLTHLLVFCDHLRGSAVYNDARAAISAATED